MSQKSRDHRLTLLDKVNVCLQEFGDHVMHLVFDVSGHIDIARLNRAVRLSLIQHPILAQRLLNHPWQPRWEPFPESLLDQHTFCQRVTSTHPKSAIDGFLIEEFDYQTNPMVAIRVVGGQQDTVCIKVSCTPIDGRGFLIYVEDLMALYERLASQPDYRPAAGDLSHCSTKALVPNFRWYDVPRLLYHGLKHQLTDARTAHNWAFPCLPSSTLEKQYYCHQCDPSTLQVLNQYRQQSGFTVNDVILAAYYQALHSIIQPSHPGPYCVLNTYDLRRYEPLGAPKRVANYSSFINSNVRLDSTTPFHDTVRAVHNAASERKRHFPGITEGPFIWPLLTFIPFALGSATVKWLLKRRGERIPVFTNVGVIPINNIRVHGQPIRNVQPYAPLEYPPKLTVTLATAGDVITFSVGYSATHFPRSLIARLFETMEQRIQEHCAQPNREAVDA